MLTLTPFPQAGTVTAEDLMRAIAKNELVLLYQPKMNCLDGQVAGAEALLRWSHPRFGLIAPDVIVGLAEQSELIHDLGNWVLRAACRQLAEWRSAGARTWSIAVNVSPLQLQRPGFYSNVCRALSDNRVPADLLVLEITESALMRDVDACMKQLFSLFGLGVQISLDDFGTGFSSLARLKQLPVQEVKIAREFIRELDRNEVDQSIVAAVIGMAASMDLRVVAEGVETEGQLQRLVQLRCDQTQGYLHAPPIRADLFLRQLGPLTSPVALPSVGFGVAHG
ncbi:EAL domain-containing protein (putative c-di-GMP-specific phosphodiesterase class I) [Stenotrophomonas rhizophila]|uniref:EAL domain-containing protein (Putative c-di-GMP-specific phosphodiesterase class I) n=1 Tax=Stenotrophomonas rhizophila TaxID=216778 RepID=A0AAP5AIJ0_9GAMM|nr:EAL domain-containing protein [Stenotrophomonas rhizophila]MDQ1109347.1 EAL domain-containing protein (putative c-di-GMP-specific phosphodiesterase class I) [Stenotrophomonas rhizophila]